MAKILTNKFLNEIREMVQINCHGDAYLEAAKEFGMVELAMGFERIMKRQQEIGYLSIEANYERHRLYEQLMAEARTQLTPEGYKIFYKAF